MNRQIRIKIFLIFTVLLFSKLSVQAQEVTIEEAEGWLESVWVKCGRLLKELIATMFISPEKALPTNKSMAR